MSNRIVVPWVTQIIKHCCAYNDEMNEQGMDVKWIPHAGPAIRDFSDENYGVIVTDLEITSGPNQGDSVMEGILLDNLRLGVVPDYWKIGTYLIRKIRGEGSANRETPVVVITNYLSKGDDFCPNARTKALDAGANEFFSLKETKSFKEIAKSIRGFAKKI